MIFKHKDAISPKRPEKYAEIERAEVRRASSVDPVALRKMSRVGRMMEIEEEETVGGVADMIEKV